MLCISFGVWKPSLADSGSLTNMVCRFLDNNQFSGSLPSAIGNLTSLEML